MVSLSWQVQVSIVGRAVTWSAEIPFAVSVSSALSSDTHTDGHVQHIHTVTWSAEIPFAVCVSSALSSDTHTQTDTSNTYTATWSAEIPFTEFPLLCHLTHTQTDTSNTHGDLECRNPIRCLCFLCSVIWHTHRRTRPTHTHSDLECRNPIRCLCFLCSVICHTHTLTDTSATYTQPLGVQKSHSLFNPNPHTTSSLTRHVQYSQYAHCTAFFRFIFQS